MKRHRTLKINGFCLSGQRKLLNYLNVEETGNGQMINFAFDKTANL